MDDDELLDDDDDAPADPSPSRAWTRAESEPSDGERDQAAEPEVSTPIPPPAPALPEPLQPPEAGRRFSAEPVAEDAVAGAPRRSAASVSSPPRLDEHAPAVAGDGDGGDDDEGAQPTAKDPRRRMLALIAAAVAVVVVLGVVLWLTVGRSGTTATPATPSPTATASESPSATPVLLDANQLLTATDLAKLRIKTTWTESPAANGAAPRPACIELASVGGASPDVEASRRFTANSDGGVLVQVAQAMADVSAATTAYEALVNQAASCADAHLLAAYQVNGLSDTATALTSELSDGTRHTMLITRTGRFVGVADASVTKTPAVGVGALSRAFAASLTKQCGNAAGACPSTPKAAETVPPATDPVGWLAWVDVPQLTPGEGKWTATDAKAPSLVGSQCEDVSLNKLPGTSDAAHRTYLLTDDSKAPDGFGIDQAIYTFSKASAATAMAKTLDDNFTGCGDRTRTATVKKDGVTAVGPDGAKLTGAGYTVTQRISATKTVTFRVGVTAVGTKLVYLLANPSANFDFTDKDWVALVGRAAQRVTQYR
jgi:hypothetical protein